LIDRGESRSIEGQSEGINAALKKLYGIQKRGKWWKGKGRP